MTDEQSLAMRTVRSMLDLGHPLENVLTSELIPSHLRNFVRDQLAREENFILTPATTLVADRGKSDWTASLDRSHWHYWPTLRQFLITKKKWDSLAIRSLEDSSDRVLRLLESPDIESFDVRGLVLGYVQSGKTANYTAVIAKAADAGFRLVIVLSGIDRGLRRQTNIRLKRELVGHVDGRSSSVRMPPIGLQWHEFTTDDLHGDFQPGNANHAALQGSQPVLLVVKKNGDVLRRLLGWLDSCPIETRRALPTLIIDDEADQASVDTRGSYQREDDQIDDDYERPSPINGLIRELLKKFQRICYVAYTATPFANILIPHDKFDPSVGNDLYPKDFIVDLPKPIGYFGAEEIFGRFDSNASEEVGGLNVIRQVSDEDLVTLELGQIPDSLENAILDFVLAGAARAQRGDSLQPSTMLVHTSQSIGVQSGLRQELARKFSELRDEWRYQRSHGIAECFKKRWDEGFRPVTRYRHPDLDVAFDLVEHFIGPFMEAVQVKEINSETGDVLDYEREPSLKAIAIGGNRLSRGLTLEGLTVSYFIRRSASYDTLMQMGRWFGFRRGYEDLTRRYTTSELEGWFSDLAAVEYRLREDISMYESQGLTPHEVGVRIWQHPTMQVTSRLKRRFATETIIRQSYSQSLEQTFKFPFNRPEDLAQQVELNRLQASNLVATLGRPSESCSDKSGPAWMGVDADVVLNFLSNFTIDPESRTISIPLIIAYIERLRDSGELTEWTVAVRGRKTFEPDLGIAEWVNVDGYTVHQIARSRITGTNSLGVITSPEDETVGLGDRQAEVREIVERATAEGRTLSIGATARELRPATEGLLLLYPISKNSGVNLSSGGKRRRLYDDPKNPLSKDLIGLAISFPKSNLSQPLDAYLEGSVGWRPVA